MREKKRVRLQETQCPFLLYTLCTMQPDSIIVFPAGVMPLPGGGWRSTTYKESDAFGVLGGRDRVEAAALLAEQYPDAYVVTTSHTLPRKNPNVAEVYANELIALGMEQKRIVKEESSNTTQAGLRAALHLAEKRGWTRLVFVSSGFHIPRIRAFLEQEHSGITVECVASEPVLAAADPAFQKTFDEVKKTPAYKLRLQSEARGLEALKRGDYKPAGGEDKRERAV